MHMYMLVIEVNDFKSEVRKAVVASEAVKKGPNHIINMHMNMYVIEVTDFRSEVRSDLRGCR